MRPGAPDRRWALAAAAALVAAFVCPLAIGGGWVFGPTLLTQAPPGLRIMSLIPGIAGPVALVAALKLRPLPRSITLLLVGGISVIALVATLEALTTGQSAGLEQIFTRGAVVMPGPRGLVLFALALTAAFTGLGLARSRPVLGARVAGLSGAALLALHLAPLGGRTPLGIVLDGVAWKTAWPVPACLVVSAAFAVVCTLLLFDDWLPHGWDQAWLVRLATLVGLGALLVLPVGLSLDSAARAPALLGTTVTLMVKVYGAWIALHVLIAAGVMGLVSASSLTDGGGGGSPASP